MLNNLFAAKDYPVEMYAIYVGDDRMAWDAYVTDKLTICNAVHLWDPEFDSDFQRKYGVLQTPRIFLISPDGVIIGRGLDVMALEILLDSINPDRTLNYGTRESEILFDGIFSMSEGKPSIGEVKGIADYIHDRTIAKGDTLMFRQMAGDYLYYLSSRSGEGVKEGLKYHIDSNILSEEDVWKSADDSLKVVGFARIMNDLLAKSAPGTKVPDIKVPGELHARNKSRNVVKKLSGLKGKTNIIIFYTERCEVCAAEKKAAKAMLSDRKLRVLMVNVDDLMFDDPSLAMALMDSFDLSSLPYILITDRDGVILRRYVSLQ